MDSADSVEIKSAQLGKARAQSSVKPFQTLYEIVFNAELGFIEITARGHWREEDVARYHADVQPFITAARVRLGRVKVFADVCACSVRPSGASVAMMEGNSRLYEPDDRIAVLTSSKLLQLQLQRNSLKDRQRVFIDRHAALEWLREG